MINWVDLLIISVFIQINTLLLSRVYYFTKTERKDPLNAWNIKLNNNAKHQEERELRQRMG